MMTKFTNFQRAMWYWLSYFSVCRYYIEPDQYGNYMIKKVGGFRLFIYYGMWTNTIVKIIYLILTYQGYLMEVHFLDQMSIWDWLLCFSQLIQETNMWYRKYPLFEVLHANWKLQEEVFAKLGHPKHVEQQILKNDKTLVVMHMMIVFIGCGALMVQFASAPKYALNTYAIVPYDNILLAFIFAAHEYLYMFHIWCHQASSIVLCEVFAVSYTVIIKEMTSVLERLIEQGHPVELPTDRTSATPKAQVDIHFRRGESYQKHNEITNATRSKIIKRNLNVNTKVPGTRYDMKTLVADYKKIMFAAQQFNNWAGFLQGGTTGSNYGQFISDVFMMIQLLKEPETDLMAVTFFLEDACAGMIMLFRMLILISRLYPASETFLDLFNVYLCHDFPDKKYWRRYKRTMHIVASKLGGYSTKAITVPKGVNALMNWYIAAAMWKRPQDRLT